MEHGHGGCRFALSRPAVRGLVSLYRERDQSERAYEELVNGVAVHDDDSLWNAYTINFNLRRWTCNAAVFRDGWDRYDRQR